MTLMTEPDSTGRRRSRPAAWWLIAIAAAALILVIAIMARNTGLFGITKVVVCDAWSMTLRDGTILTPPPEAIPSGQVPGNGVGPCWDLPGWVTSDDLQ